MTRPLVCAVFGVLVACKPQLPLNNDIDTVRPDEDPPEVEDTAVEPQEEPPCAAPEIEPNALAEDATLLPMETVGCGIFGAPADLDQWTIDLPEAGWLSIDLRSYRIGSPANVSLTVASDSLAESARVTGWRGLPDVALVFPAVAETFSAIVVEEAAQGDETGRYHYEIFASGVKEPVVWDSIEIDDPEGEQNNTPETAQRIVDGVGEHTVFGQLIDDDDADWFEVVLPSDRATVRIDIDAAEFGSAGDYLVRVRDGNGELVVNRSVGAVGWERDPWIEVPTYAADIWRIEVVEEGSDHGAPYWYTLNVSVEGPE